MDMRKSRLSKKKQSRLIEHFVSGSTARTAASLVDVNKTTAAYYYCRLREIIFLATEDETAFSGEIEVDESHFAEPHGYNEGFPNINGYLARLMERPACALPAVEKVP